MSIKYLGIIAIFLAISCNRGKKQKEQDYKVIETDYLIIKSTFDFQQTKMLVKRHKLLKEITTKDPLNFITLSGYNSENQSLDIMICDEKFTYNKNKFREIDNELVKQLDVKPYVYSDTIINSNKIELRELKVHSNHISLTANILKGTNCYPLTLLSDDENYTEHKRSLFEVLQGTTIKE